MDFWYNLLINIKMQLGSTSSHLQQNIFSTQAGFVPDEMSQGPSEKIEAI